MLGYTFSETWRATAFRFQRSFLYRARYSGPAPRDLDEFAAEFQERVSRFDREEVRYEVLVVDTRELICGRTSDGERAEECEFAPPFD